MNKRIQELAKQASFLNQDEESIEYFATLIVADCVRIIEGYFDESPEIMGLPLDILEHFDMELPE